MPKVISETLQMAIPTRAVQALYFLRDAHDVLCYVVFLLRASILDQMTNVLYQIKH